MESPAWDGEEWGSERTLNLVFPVMEQSLGPTLPTASRNPVSLPSGLLRIRRSQELALVWDYTDIT